MVEFQKPVISQLPFPGTISSENSSPDASLHITALEGYHKIKATLIFFVLYNDQRMHNYLTKLIHSYIN